MIRLQLNAIFDFLSTPVFKYQNYELTPMRLLLLALVIVGSRLLISSIGHLLKRGVFSKQKIDEGRQQGVIQLFKYAIYVFATLAALQTMGVQISLLLAGSAALLVGVGLGLQNTFNDFVAGLILLFEGSIETGDIIEIDKMIGRITRIRLRASEMVTREGVELIIPNSKFINASIVNWSHTTPLKEFTIRISIAYQANPQQVSALLNACALAHKYVAQLPHPVVEMTDFGDSGIVYELAFWTANIWDIDRTKSDLRFAILESLQQHQIEIPYPHRVVQMKSEL
jgi:small-conductance mechanosensitive channel